MQEEEQKVQGWRGGHWSLLQPAKNTTFEVPGGPVSHPQGWFSALEPALLFYGS